MYFTETPLPSRSTDWKFRSISATYGSSSGESSLTEELEETVSESVVSSFSTSSLGEFNTMSGTGDNLGGSTVGLWLTCSTGITSGNGCWVVWFVGDGFCLSID